LAQFLINLNIVVLKIFRRLKMDNKGKKEVFNIASELLEKNAEYNKDKVAIYCGNK